MAKYIKTEEGYKPLSEIKGSIIKLGREDKTAEMFNVNGKIENNTLATGQFSHAEGESTTASGNSSHSEGKSTVASGYYSHAEGYGTTASGYYSHAEGYETTASGYNSHAEGLRTTASGEYAHTEGSDTIARGAFSHAEGDYTSALSNCQHVQGRCNLLDYDNKYAHIVGNGKLNGRSNAHTLDWNGNSWYQGILTAKDLIIEDSNGKAIIESLLTTIQDLQSQINTLTERLDAMTSAE